MAVVTGAAAITAGASIYSGKRQADAANKASKRSQQTARAQMSAEADQARRDRELQQRRFGEATTALRPFVEREKQALSRLGQEQAYLGYLIDRDQLKEGTQYTPVEQEEYFNRLGGGFEQFLENPAFQKILDVGAEQAERSAAASGQLMTGTLTEELRDYGQQTAQQAFGDYLTQFNILQDVNEQRRVNAQNTAENRYTNYLNLLERRAAPTSTTNLANLGLNQAANLQAQGAASVAAQNRYMGEATAAANAAAADRAAAYGQVAKTVGQLAPTFAQAGQGIYDYFTAPSQTSGTVAGGGGTQRYVRGARYY